MVSGRWKQDVSREGAVRSKGSHLVEHVLSHGKRPWAVWELSYPALYWASPALPHFPRGQHLTPSLGWWVRGQQCCLLEKCVLNLNKGSQPLGSTGMKGKTKTKEKQDK